jgi:VWFA-related protein
MKRAEEENVLVYAIGLNPSDPYVWSTGLGKHDGAFSVRYGGGRPLVGNHPDEGLPKIAAATGGGYFDLTSTNDLAAMFARVADELHHQYALGFAPDKLDGKMHALDVRVTGDGRVVRARRSYLARAGGNS